METLNKGHFRTALFVLCKEVVLFGKLTCTRIIWKNILGPQAVSFVKRFIVLCPSLGECTIGDSAVVF